MALVYFQSKRVRADFNNAAREQTEAEEMIQISPTQEASLSTKSWCHCKEHDRNVENGDLTEIYRIGLVNTSILLLSLTTFTPHW